MPETMEPAPLFCQLMSSHLRPKSSPCRAPVIIAIKNRVKYFWLGTCSSKIVI